MKRGLKLTVITMVLMTMLTLAGCGGAGTEGDQQKNGEALPTIGIVQIMEHPSLNTIRESLIEQLAAEGFVDKETVIIDYQDAQSDATNLKTICQKFVNNNYDMIIAIATPSAQSAAGETNVIPIIFSAVTDPIKAQLVESLEVPGGNITGTSDYIDVSKIMELAKQLTPEMKTVGALYSSSETNSESVVADLEEYAAANGLKVIRSAVTASSEIQQATAALAGKVDVIFAPIDNTVASAMPIASKTAADAGVPIYVSADSMVKDGGLATCGINYKTLGQETGIMAAKVLNGADPGQIPVKVMDDMAYYINSEVAAKLGITIPDDVMKNATDLAE